MSNKLVDILRQVHEQYKGGAGSGNFGHGGRPGHVGGSSSGGAGGGGVPDWLANLPAANEPTATASKPQGRSGKIAGGGAFDWEVNGENYKSKLIAVAEAGADKRKVAKATRDLGGSGDRRDGLGQVIKGVFGARYETTVNDYEGNHDYYYRGQQEWRVHYNPRTDRTNVEYTKL